MIKIGDYDTPLPHVDPVGPLIFLNRLITEITA